MIFDESARRKGGLEKQYWPFSERAPLISANLSGRALNPLFGMNMRTLITTGSAEDGCRAFPEAVALFGDAQRFDELGQKLFSLLRFSRQGLNEQIFGEGKI